MDSQKIVKIFHDIARMLELKGDNPFRIKAYERASHNIEDFQDDLKRFIIDDRLTEIDGIGKDLAQKIKEIYETGDLKYYQELKAQVPQGLLDMLDIPGLGPKTVKLFYDKLGIDSVEKLEKAAKDGKLRGLEGVKDKTESNIIKGIEIFRGSKERLPYVYGENLAQVFLTELKGIAEVKKIEVAGSLRRKKDTVRDVDILVVSSKAASVMEKFVKVDCVTKILAKGETKSSVLAGNDNMQVDLRVVDDKSFGAALMYFTGSKEFNVKMRKLAMQNNWKLNEYGLFKEDKEKEKLLAAETEEDIFKVFKMKYLPPELREDRGEIELALSDKLPDLIEIKDIKGDFHVHSNYSDGFSTIAQIADKVSLLGYDYVSISDHSESLKVANGLDKQRLSAKIDEIKKVNREFKTLSILCGTEVDILSNGSLDYPKDVLAGFDVVIAAIHSGFKQTSQQLTKRMIAAIKTKQVHILAHPSGKLWGQRGPYEFDFEEVCKACRDYNAALEIDCHPHRLDLNDVMAMKAKHMGVKLAINTDAHQIKDLDAMGLGVNVARRAWLNKEDVINCMTREQLKKWLKR